MTDTTLLHPGDSFPELTVALPGGRSLQLPGTLAGHFGVVLFYRGSWCPYCNAQLSAFQRSRDGLAALGVSVVALSVNDEAPTQNLIATAIQSQQSNNNAYRVGTYTFNIGFNTVTALTSNLSSAQTQAGNIDIYEVPSQNWSNDAITNYDNAMSNINSVMPKPGGGTKVAGDTPQEVMFFVTDGVEDEMVSGSRQQSLMSNSWCTTIKNRGIRIAVLYTTYLPLPTNAWYNTYIAPFQSQIGPTLKSCASPDLYFEVKTDQDISAAMVALFQKALATARLTR
jgi:thiol-disulfide isomerase/thioredoxin